MTENKRSYLSVMIFLFLLGLLVACGEDHQEPIPSLELPRMVSSSPANGSENISAGEQIIVLEFDQNVVLNKAPEITLNGDAVKEASAAFKELKIKVKLKQATTYTLLVPAGRVKGPTGLTSDEIVIRFTTRGYNGSTVRKTLVTANPSAQAQKVYDFLLDNYGKKMITGAMANVNWNTNEAEWVYKHTGKYPALNCFDYVHLHASPANWIDYGNIEVVQEWWANNGLVAAGWHWNVPTLHNADAYGFYVINANKGEGETSFDVTKAVQEGTYENNVVKADLNKIADYLLLLKQKNIPVLWRPLHEASGRWFWWGGGDAESYRKLWVLMFQTFRDKGLDNLIWVWTSQANDDDWYPGDEYVDIIGCDIYAKDLDGISAIYDALLLTYPDKLITLSECGNIAPLPEQWNAGVRWSWMMPWYDHGRTVNTSSDDFNKHEHLHADVAYWKQVMEDDFVITRDKMPNLK